MNMSVSDSNTETRRRRRAEGGWQAQSGQAIVSALCLLIAVSMNALPHKLSLSNSHGSLRIHKRIILPLKAPPPGSRALKSIERRK